MDDRSKVEQRVGLLAFARISELEFRPVEGNFNAAHLKEIHRRIFQDSPVYAPGEYRPDAPGHSKIRVLETSGVSYPVFYVPRSNVDSGVDKVLSAFGGPESLRGLNAEQFSGRMAKLYGYLDFLHPFKEGNSRTLRSFTAQLADEVGMKLDWFTSAVDGKSRDRLYIARDIEVIRHVIAGIDHANKMTSDEKDAMLFLASYQHADTLKTIIRESTYPVSELDRPRKEPEPALDKVMSDFKIHAGMREMTAYGYGDTGKKWNALPEQIRKTIDDYNVLPNDARTLALAQMRQDLRRDPAAVDKLAENLVQARQQSRSMGR
ncbi:MAG: Fic family protein [Pseudomonadota bacterium]